MPCRNGRKGGSVSRCRLCAATTTYAGGVCVVCASDEDGRLNSLVSIILRARPICCVSVMPCTIYSLVSSVIPTLDRNRGEGALKPSSSDQSQI